LALSACAPVLLIGGWTVAGQLQPSSYDPLQDTISSLAGLGARDRWVMTTASIGLGLCYVLIAYGLRAAANPGRLMLVAGGAATLLVTGLPLPRVGSSTSHGTVAAAGFVAMAVWPLGSSRRATFGTQPWALRKRAAGGATLGLLLLLGCFGLALSSHEFAGLAERAAAGAEALWPLVVVLSVRAAIPQDAAIADGVARTQRKLCR
jgi:hypothetical membrane protein